VRIALLTEGGYPYARGEGGAWCDRLVRGLPQHDFDVYALSRSAATEAGGAVPSPRNVRRLRTARLWGPPDPAASAPAPERGRAARRARTAAFRWHFGELAAALAGGATERAERADRFAAGLYGLAGAAAEHGGLAEQLRGDDAIAALEAACRAPRVRPLLADITVTELLTAADLLERQLRPLALPWYGDGELAAADLCHAASGGPAALPGLLAKRFCGTPLVVTEYTVRLREALLAHRAAGLTPAVRLLLGDYHRLLAGEVYRRAALITPGSTHVRRWQERCGAPRERMRTVHPGIDAARFARAGEAAEAEAAEAVARSGQPADPRAPVDPVLVWVGRPDPAKDLIALLHAFHAIRAEEPGARLRIFLRRGGGAGAGGAPAVVGGAAAVAGDAAALAGDAAAGVGGAAGGGGAPAAGTGAGADPAARYLDHCRALAAQLFPDEAESAHAVGESPVTFEEVGSPAAPDLADAYAAGDVVVLSSSAEGFPLSLVEAMFCGRATVSTDVGAVREVIGGTGLVVPPRNPRALAGAALSLLRDPERAARLGAAARERALALFTVTRCVEAFREGYLDVVAHHAVAREPLTGPAGAARPFAAPAESWSPTPLAPLTRRADVPAPTLEGPRR
jgi:glycosyltransferase involved in cell wall biosynthesis